MSVERRFKSALRLAARTVRRFFPEYAAVGRFARNFYAPPETTLDVDFLVDLDDAERVNELLEYASARFEVFPLEVGHWQYRLVVKGFRFDLVKPRGYRYDAEAASRRRLVRIEEVGELAFLSPEDLAVLFLVSSLDRGVRDLIKAKDIVAYSKARGDFNEEYFLRKCVENRVKHLGLALLMGERARPAW